MSLMTEYRSLIIMLSSNQVWLRLSCICWELRLMPDWLPPVKGWWNLVSQSFPINKRLLVVRVCTLSSIQCCCTPPTYIPMIHPQHWPLIGQPGLLTVLWLVSPTCLVLLPGESGAAASLAATVFDSPCQTWPGLDWLLHLGLLRPAAALFSPLEEFASITFLCSQIYGQNSKIRYKVIILGDSQVIDQLQHWATPQH